MPTAALKTFGCKLNQYETEQIREQLQQLGYRIVDLDSPADLYVINSCTVTHQADRDTRRLARRVKRRSPDACVVVTGCYAEVSAAELQAIPEIDLVCGMGDKRRLGELASRLSAEAPLAPGEPDPGTWPAGGVPGAAWDGSPLIQEFAEHTRCFVKVQEGCNARCAYCIIPAARGPSRSVPLDEVIAQARQLARAGHPEVVLIGTHLGRYGQGLGEALDLADLVERLVTIPELQRLRLSSIEPREVTERLIGMMRWTSGPPLCGQPRGSRGPCSKLSRHLHIPLQSGCDSILRRMNRPYDTARYADLIHRVHQAQPATGLGADVIVGFPGETDEEFEQTCRFIESLPLSYLHVFTYSKRRGTPAASMPDQVPHDVALARNHVLRELSEAKREAFARSMVGETLGVVMQTDEGHGWLRGVTDNYLQLRVEAPPELLQTVVACEVRAAEGAVLEGSLFGFARK